MKKFALALGAFMLFAAPAFAFGATDCKAPDTVKAEQATKSNTVVVEFATDAEISKVKEWAFTKDGITGALTFNKVIVFTDVRDAAGVTITMYEGGCLTGSFGYPSARMQEIIAFVKGA